MTAIAGILVVAEGKGHRRYFNLAEDACLVDARPPLSAKKSGKRAAGDAYLTARSEDKPLPRRRDDSEEDWGWPPSRP